MGLNLGTQMLAPVILRSSFYHVDTCDDKHHSGLLTTRSGPKQQQASISSRTSQTSKPPMSGNSPTYQQANTSLRTQLHPLMGQYQFWANQLIIQPCPPAAQHQDWNTPGHTASHARTCPCHQQLAAFTLLRAWQPNQRRGHPTTKEGPLQSTQSALSRAHRSGDERAVGVGHHRTSSTQGFTSPRSGSVTNLPNTKNQATEEYGPNEGIK